MASAQSSKSLYISLRRRNYFIAILRFIVPLFGLAILGFLLLQIIISNIAGDYNISGVRIVNDKLIIDQPEYSGVMANGAKYDISSISATTALRGSDDVDLYKAKFDLIRVDNSTMQATSDNASFNMVEQIVLVKGLMDVNISSGVKAQLYNSIIDWQAQTLNSKDNAVIEFNDGSILRSNSLLYNAEEETWTFEKVTLTIPIEEEKQ